MFGYFVFTFCWEFLGSHFIHSSFPVTFCSIANPLLISIVLLPFLFILSLFEFESEENDGGNFKAATALEYVRTSVSRGEHRSESFGDSVFFLYSYVTKLPNPDGP